MVDIDKHTRGVYFGIPCLLYEYIDVTSGSRYLEGSVSSVERDSTLSCCSGLEFVIIRENFAEITS